MDAEVKRIQDRATRDVQRAAQVEQSAAERSARERIRVEERMSREIQRIKERAARETAREGAEKNRAAANWVRREERGQLRQASEERRNRTRFAGAIGGAAASGIAAGAHRIAGAAIGTAGIVGQLGGGFSIADSVQRAVGLKGKLADIASRDVDPTDPTKSKRKSTAELEGKVRGVSTEFGIEADTGADALDKFASKTGELGTGLDMLRGLAELSRAGAGSLDDLADAAGDIFNADKTQNAEQVLQKLRQFAVQGQKGAVEMKDLASQMAKIGAAAGRFEGGADKNLATMGALTQLARASGGAASSREATTAVSSLSNQFYKNARLEGFQNLGVQVKTKEGYNRSVDDVVFETMLGAEKKSRAGGKGMQRRRLLVHPGGGLWVPRAPHVSPRRIHDEAKARTLLLVIARALPTTLGILHDRTCCVQRHRRGPTGDHIGDNDPRRDSRIDRLRRLADE
jgi:hypothetical protein